MTRAEFEEKIWPMRDKLYRVAYYLLSDEDKALDAVQNVMIKIWGKRKNLDDVQNIEAFLVKSTKNHCLDQIKSNKRELYNGDKQLLQAAGWEEQDDLLFEHEDGLDPDLNGNHSNIIRLIIKALETLPQKQKLVMKLRDIEGMDMEEIEMITGMKSGTIRVNLSRARTSVKEKLKHLNIPDIR